jgi:hypothetical protein
MIVPPPGPAPVAAPVIVPPPAPVIAAPAAAPAIAPVIAPAPPAAERRAVAAVAPPSSGIVATKLDPRTVEQIFSCLAPGLPQDWKKTWVVVTSEAAVNGKFYVTSSYRDEDAEEFVPCNAQEVTRRIAALSDSLPPEQRRWKSARLAIDSEGEYELKYDYAK